jgi:PAS domain S-box-containing protein
MNGHLLENDTRDNTLDKLMEGFQLIGYDWKYLYVNEAIVRQSKYSREELLGSTMMEKYPGFENTLLFDTLQTCMREKTNNTIENEFQFPDGSRGWFELRIQSVPEGLFILSVDITDRRNAETERKEYIRGLEEMIYMTSHQLRQPIANITGLIDLLEQGTEKGNDKDLAIGFMQQSIRDLDAFTEDLTEFIYALKKKASEYEKRQEAHRKNQNDNFQQ